MPLFKCDKCGCIENTALTDAYWSPKNKQHLCSECSMGKWHGAFPKETPEESGFVEDADGFYSKK